MIDREILAKELHEASRQSVLQGNTVAAEKWGSKTFIEWDDCSENVKEGRRIQADYLLSKYYIHSKEADQGCCVKGKLRDALNKFLDYARLKETDLNHVILTGDTTKDAEFNKFVETSPFIFDGHGSLRIFGLISGITEILTGERLAWKVDERGGVTEVKWVAYCDTICSP
jgi:hypothetical protein